MSFNTKGLMSSNDQTWKTPNLKRPGIKRPGFMKGLYLCAREHRLSNYDIDYNDIEYFEGINLLCDCKQISFNQICEYDFIIATPPCNYYSRMNWRRNESEIALVTKDLLPYCLDICIRSGKPFIVENVVNTTLINQECGDLLNKCYVFTFGEHTFMTNIFMLVNESNSIRQNKQYITRSKRNLNYNVDYIIKEFLKIVVDKE